MGRIERLKARLSKIFGSKENNVEADRDHLVFIEVEGLKVHLAHEGL